MVATFPEDPEAWSESLTPAEGYWHVVGPVSDGQAWSVYLDRVYKKSGEACIAGRYGRADPNNTVIQIAFDFYEVQDLRPQQGVRFLHMLTGLINGKPAFMGECAILIYDSEYNVIWKKFGTVPGGGYEAKDWDLRSDFILGRGESIDAVLSNATRILFQFYIPYDTAVNGPWGQISCIDRIYFAKALGTLYVQSKPSGKAFTFDGRGFVTPHGFRGAVGDEHDIIMGDTEFIKWEDGSTSRTRVVTIPEGSAVVMAYYEEEKPPPPPGIPPEALAALGIVFVASISVLLLGGRWLKVK